MSCRLESAFRERLVVRVSHLIRRLQGHEGMASSKCLKHNMVFLQTFSECTLLGSDISRCSLIVPSAKVLEQV